MTAPSFIGKLFARLLHNFPYLFFLALFITIIIAIAYYVIFWRFGWLDILPRQQYKVRKPVIKKQVPSTIHPRPVAARKRAHPVRKTISHARFKKKQIEKKKKRAEALKAFEK